MKSTLMSEPASPADPSRAKSRSIRTFPIATVPKPKIVVMHAANNGPTIRSTVLRRRFVEEGLAGLHDKPRSGRPPVITARTRAQVVAKTLKPPGAGLTHWSARELAAAVGVSHTTVHRIWKAHDLQPHRIDTFKFSTDPDAEAKIHDVVGLYLHPPTNAVVLSVDEKTQIQALNRTQPILPLRPGLPARQTHDYKRNGLTSLYAALDVAAGSVIGACTERHTSADFLRFLKLLRRRYQTRDLHVILDNSSTHKTKRAGICRRRF